MNFQKQNLIEFSFTHHKNIFTLSIENLLNDISKSLHTKIKEKCLQFNIIVYEKNLKLYDIENNVNINKYDDLLDYDTKKCRIIIVPIVLDE